MLKQRIITAFILLLLLLSAVFALPPLAWFVLVGVVVLLGLREWVGLAKMSGMFVALYWLATLLFLLCLYWIYFRYPPEQKFIFQLVIYGAAAIFWVLIVPLWLAGLVMIKQPWSLGLVGWMLLIPTGMAMLDLRAEAQQPWWLLGVMGVVWVADIAAYFSGKKFGKHKLAPSISPGKTWEGVAGATLGVLVYIVVVMQMSGMTQRYSLILFALIGVVFSVLGDLFESAIKRQAGVKDSGTLLPGHGGLLDRIDALTSTLPLAALMLILMRLA